MGIRAICTDPSLEGFAPSVLPLVTPSFPSTIHEDALLWGILVDRVGREMYISSGIAKKDYFPILVLHSFKSAFGLDSFTITSFVSFCSASALCSKVTSANWFKALQHSKLIEYSHKTKSGTYYKMTEKGTFKLNAILYGLNQRVVQRAEYWSAYLEKRPIRRELFKVDRDWLRGLNPQKVTKPVPELYDHCPQL